MSNSNHDELLQESQHTHAIKIERTAKGARVTVHVFVGKESPEELADNREKALREATYTYADIIDALQKHGYTVAPIEGKNIGITDAINQGDADDKIKETNNDR